MAKPFLTDPARQALAQAVRAVEAGSSAELVVAVRPRSGSYLHADLIAGAVTALAALVFLVFSPWPFAPAWLVADPYLAGLLGAFLSSRLPSLRRALTRAALRRERVERAARSAFVERRVHGTSGRTGVLFYMSVLEREAAFVVDTGVEPVAATSAWRTAAGEIEAAVRRGEDGVAVAARIETLAPILAAALPCAADDVDELANEVCE
jgi:putative membrane protein